MTTPVTILKILLPTLMMASLLTACDNSNSHDAQGYVEGRYTYVSSNVSGVLQKLMVARGASIKKGDSLFELDPQPESDLYTAASENLKEAISARDAMAANLEYARLTYERYQVLVPKKAIQQSELDNAKSIYQSTVAQLAQANATINSTTAKLAQAEWALKQKNQRSPVNGMVFDTYYRLGENTEANKAILSLLAPQDIKVIFYVREEQLRGLKIGNSVHVRCDNCRDSIAGSVSFISPTAEYTPPVIYSNETNAKLIYRIEAEFKPVDAVRLHPGQPVIVTYQVT